MSVCVVSGCSNRIDSNNPTYNQSLTFHRFPTDITQKEAWLTAIHTNEWIPSYTSCVCSEHFEEHHIDRTSFSQVTIKDNAVPTILLNDPLYLSEDFAGKNLNVPREGNFDDKGNLVASNKEINPESSFKIMNTDDIHNISVNQDDLSCRLKKASHIMDDQKKQIKVLQQTIMQQSQQISKLQKNICILKKQKTLSVNKKTYSNLTNYPGDINEKKIALKRKHHNEIILVNDERFLESDDPDNSNSSEGSLYNDESLKGDVIDTSNYVENENIRIKKRKIVAKNMRFRETDAFGSKTLMDENVNETVKDFTEDNIENEEIRANKPKKETLKSNNKTPKGNGVHTKHCPICDEQFYSSSDLKKHRDSTHKGPHTCKTCAREFSTWRAIVKHDRVHANESKSRICEICSKEFETSLKLTKHRYTHKVYAKIICTECGKEFTRKENLTRHMLLHKNIKRHKCELCVEEFTRSDQLKIHMNVFHSTNSERQYCTICKYNTAQKLNLRAHMLSKHLVKVDKDMRVIGFKTPGKSGSFKCSLCDKVLGSYQALGTHTRIHNGISKFLCKHCGKYFNTKLGLDVHERTHTGERPYPCKLCPKKFSQRTCLTTHMLTHTGERPHQCKVCQKRFTQSQHLRAHVLLHTGERKHVCNICNKSFTLRDGLRYHKMTHTGLTPYVCQICNRGFYIPYKLKVHMAKNHSIASTELKNETDELGRQTNEEQHNIESISNLPDMDQTDQ